MSFFRDGPARSVQIQKSHVRVKRDNETRSNQREWDATDSKGERDRAPRRPYRDDGLSAIAVLLQTAYTERARARHASGFRAVMNRTEQILQPRRSTVWGTWDHQS